MFDVRSGRGSPPGDAHTGKDVEAHALRNPGWSILADHFVKAHKRLAPGGAYQLATTASRATHAASPTTSRKGRPHLSLPGRDKLASCRAPHPVDMRRRRAAGC